MRTFPAFELDADLEDVAAMARDATLFAKDGVAGSTWSLMFKTGDGRAWIVAATQGDLEYKFEVFSLGVRRLDLASRADLAWEAWPLGEAQVEVLRRAEFIIEDVDVEAFGSNPGLQTAAPPGQVPAEAAAACEVAVGLLLADGQGRQMLVAADWNPLRLLVTQDSTLIEDFTSTCERVTLHAYADQLGAARG